MMVGQVYQFGKNNDVSVDLSSMGIKPLQVELDFMPISCRGKVAGGGGGRDLF